MKRQGTLLSLLVLASMLFAGHGARADYYYNFGPVDSPTVYSDNSGMGINLSNQPQVGPIATSMDTNVVATTLTTFINQGVTGTDTFSTGQHSGLALTIVDGNQNGTVQFGLNFSGTLAANNSQLKVDFESGDTKSMTINGNQYTVKLDTIVPPGVPGAIPGGVGGTIYAGIYVEPGGGGDNGGGDNGGGGTNPPSNTPEPSTMLLSGLGLSLLSLASWRRRGRQK